METEQNNGFTGENIRLLAELELKDQLIEQLSQEIFRLVKVNLKLQTETAAAFPSTSQQGENETQKFLPEEEQVKLYKEEIMQLRETITNLTEHNQKLEKLLEQLPQLYRNKFSAKMVKVKEKIEVLQQENKQLYAELQSVSYRLAVRSRGQSQVSLPEFINKKTSSSIPSFGNV